MKKIIHYSDFLDMIGYAVGDCIGEMVTQKLGLQGIAGFILPLVICFAIGTPGTILISRIEKKKGGFKRIDLLFALAGFLIVEILCRLLLHTEFSLYLLGNLLYYLVFGLLAFLLHRGVLYLKIRKARQRFGSGENGLSLGKRVIRDTDAQAEDGADEAIDEKTLVCCDAGTFAGKKSGGVFSYKGIKYAADPVGALRWKAPEPAPVYDGVFKAYSFSEIVPQPDSILFNTAGIRQGESCLSVNIWTPSLPSKGKKAEDAPGEGLPVIVWFHGGDFTDGGSAFPLYDGTGIVKSNGNIVFVTFNYRFGVFGMMNFDSVPGGEEYADAKNLALLDQIAALKWVKKNIAAFGGDGDNITACGEAAGADCLALLNVCDKAKGLYRRAVIMSAGSGHTTSLEDSAKFTEKIMKKFKLRDMNDFLNLSVRKLIKIVEEYYIDLNYPIVTGDLVPKDLLAEYSAGKSAGIDIIMISNKDETNAYIMDVGEEKSAKLGEISMNYLMEHLTGDAKDAAQDYLKRKSPKEFICSMLYNCPAMLLCKEHMKCGNSAYYIYWVAGSPIEKFGAFAGFEVPFILENEKSVESYGVVGDTAVGRLTQKLIVSFAKDGRPVAEAGSVEHNSEIRLEKYGDTVPVYIADYSGITRDDGTIWKDSEEMARVVSGNEDIIRNMYAIPFDEYYD